MSQVPYPRYRSTGSMWIDRVPSHWRVEKLKFSAHIRASNVDKHSHDGEIPIRLCNYSDVYNNGRITADLPFMEATAATNEIEKFSLRAGDVIITKDSESWDDIAVPAYVPQDIDGVLCGYHLAQIHPHSNELDGAYLCYLLKSQAMNRQFQVSANGVTRFGLSVYYVDNATILIPPLDEQRAIVRFLDAKTAQIAELIAKKERLVQLLAEKRVATIAQAVTRGRNPDVAIKESGISWLGSIPAHWKIKQIKRVLGNGEYGISDSLDKEGEFGVLRMGDLVDGEIDTSNAAYVAEVDPALLLDRNDLVFNRTNSLDLVGKMGIFRGRKADRVTFASYLVRFRCVDADPEYMNFLLNTPSFLTYARSLSFPAIGQANLNPQRYGQIHICVPPLDEQQRIAIYLRSEIMRIQSGAAYIRSAIDRLGEYRASLISSAVAGQIDLRSDDMKMAAQ